MHSSNISGVLNDTSIQKDAYSSLRKCFITVIKKCDKFCVQLNQTKCYNIRVYVRRIFDLSHPCTVFVNLDFLKFCPCIVCLI